MFWVFMGAYIFLNLVLMAYTYFFGDALNSAGIQPMFAIAALVLAIEYQFEKYFGKK